ncbi:DUF397 domain-containing protein [Streptomyces sp. NPDC014733]|uniref:DUF397 domain-containing protein n=1 Tax=Streptomyces sp. NPDC014733 TaxID=3364885 RepID=UPI0036FBDD69
MPERHIRDAATLRGWRKSTYSGAESGSCVEIYDGHPTAVPVRDSKNPHGPALLIPADGWTAFIAGVKGEAFAS